MCLVFTAINLCVRHVLGTVRERGGGAGRRRELLMYLDGVMRDAFTARVGQRFRTRRRRSSPPSRRAKEKRPMRDEGSKHTYYVDSSTYICAEQLTSVGGSNNHGVSVT